MAEAIIKIGLDNSNFQEGMKTCNESLNKFNKQQGITKDKFINVNREIGRNKRALMDCIYRYQQLGEEGRKTDAGRKLLDIKEKCIQDIKALQAVKDEMEALTKTKTKINIDTSNISTANGGISSLIGKFSSAKAAVGGFMGAFAVSALVDFGREAIDAQSKVEQLEISFRTLLGSQEKASALIAEIKSYGTVTPYDTEGLAQAARLMLSYGMSSSKIMPTLQMLGDIAMGDKDKLQSLTLAFSQMSASGRVCKEDLNQMVDAGFNPLQIISEKTGKSIGELTDEVSKGAISVQDIEQAFIDATSEGGKFHNMVNNMSDSIAGKTAQMTDNWEAFKASIGGLLRPAYLGAIQTTTSAIDAMTKAIERLRASAGDVTVGDGNYSNSTQNALKYATDKGNKGGKTQKQKEAIRKKTIGRGIAYEVARGKRIDNAISQKSAELQTRLNHPTWTGKKTKAQLKNEIASLIHQKAQTNDRIKSYRAALNENPYETPKPTTTSIPSGGGGGGRRNTNKGGGGGGTNTNNTNTEVIPHGSLAELEKELTQARKAASLAVGEEAYNQAMETVSKIEDKIGNFKFNSYKNAENSPIKDNDLSKMKMPKNGVLGVSLGLPKKDELEDFAKTIADSMEKVREETQRTEEEFKNLTDSIRNQYGGQIADFATRFAELAKFIQDGGSTTEAAAVGLVMLGDSLQTIAGNGAIAKAGAIMAAIGQCVLGFATASAQAAALGPFGWLAFVGAGLGTLATMISTIQGFSEGGIIGGGLNHGDMQLARVNAGEMILNNSQQARLFELLDGGAAMIGNTQGKVDFRISGQALVGTLKNYNTKMSKVR
ncbi:tape measure protein [Prevotella copri]|uniref:Tape measure protein n=1 Tax=Segatella copri TaxID=165179 RepID=A0A6I2U0N3_9BACT|nr:tape measure protein [Segatella copri]MST78422.1 tape measure protein [Segatella copri]